MRIGQFHDLLGPYYIHMLKGGGNAIVVESY
jgi:hypothetical protein